MQLTEKGDFIEFRDKKLTVGDRIVAVGNSNYAGLIGIIVAIEQGKITETHYTKPVIYCDFNPPIMPAFGKYIKDKVFETNGEDVDVKKLKHIRQEPDMVMPYFVAEDNPRKSVVYIITECRAVNGEEVTAKTMYLDYATALKSYECILRKEQEHGMLSQMRRKGHVVKINPYSFEYYPRWKYKKRHYCLKFESMYADISESFFNQIGKEYCNKQLRERIREDLPGLDCMECLSEDEAISIVEHPEFPAELDLRISEELYITDKYLEVLEEIAEEYIQELFPEKAEQKED